MNLKLVWLQFRNAGKIAKIKTGRKHVWNNEEVIFTISMIFHATIMPPNTNVWSDPDY